jgi:hypothetical protein
MSPQPTTTSRQPDFEKIARIQGAAWERCGFDVLTLLQRHVPYWPGSRSQQLMLAAEALRAAAELAE